MRKFIFIGLGVIFLHLSFSVSSYAQCGQLIWADEFNDGVLDNTKWDLATGDGCPSLCGWGNEEAQSYSASSNNVREENGSLVLEAINTGGNITSGRITTQ